jgi:hypothetical protein
MTEEENRKNLNLAKAIYKRYCRLMDNKEYSKAQTNLNMWFITVEQIVKLGPVGKENTS